MKKPIELQKEERLNAVSHAIGAIFGVIGFFLLLSKNAHKSNYAIFSIVVYSFTLVLMFLTSAGYHFVSKQVSKRRFRILDHISIYLLIAGTYTPMTLITLINAKGWMICYTVWGIAAFGTVLKLFFTGRFEFMSLILYLAMGWLIVLDYDNLMDQTPSLGLRLLFLGGAFYTFGVLFYAIERIPYNHFIWHVFVMAGAMSHWLMIYFYMV